MRLLLLALLMLPWPCWAQNKELPFVRDSSGSCYNDATTYGFICASDTGVRLISDLGAAGETYLQVNSGSPGIVSTNGSFQALGSLVCTDVGGGFGDWSVVANAGTGNATYSITGAIDHHVFVKDVQIPDGLTVGTNGTKQVQTKCGAASIDFGAIAALTSATASDTGQTGLAANDACFCSPRTDFDDDYVMKFCKAGTDTLSVTVYNALAILGPDPAAVTVDYCCTRHP